MRLALLSSVLTFLASRKGEFHHARREDTMANIKFRQSNCRPRD